MKRFLIRLLMFGLMLSFTFVASWWWNTLRPYSTRLDGRHYNVIVLGDSHVKRGIDPDLLVAADNICQHAEPYSVTYWKLKEALHRCTVDTVILGFTHHNLSTYNNLKFIDPQWSTEMFRRTYFIGEFDELNDEVEIDRAGFFKVYFRNVFTYPKSSHDTWIGEFSSSVEWDVSDPLGVIDRRYKVEGKPTGISEFNLSYLDSIVELCRRKELQLILVGCPLSAGYRALIPTLFVNRYVAELERYQSYERVLVLNFTEESYPNYLFINPDHLNRAGSKRLTFQLIDSLHHQASIGISP